MPQPFIIYTLSRSRTAWLSEFLTYGPWFVEREIAIGMRSLDDVANWFACPNVGTVETAACYGHWLLRQAVPGIREAVVRRPVEAVIQSSLAAGEAVGITYDESHLRRLLTYGERMLTKISARPGVLTLDYADLETEAGCRAIFEFCLETSFNREWWLRWRDVNVQISLLDLVRYYAANLAEITTWKQTAKAELRHLVRTGKLKELV